MIWQAVEIGFGIFLAWWALYELEPRFPRAVAFVRLMIGAGLLCWRLPPGLLAPWLYPWASGAVSLVALWLVVSGFVHWLTRRRQPPLPPPRQEVERDISANEFHWNG